MLSTKVQKRYFKPFFDDYLYDADENSSFFAQTYLVAVCFKTKPLSNLIKMKTKDTHNTRKEKSRESHKNQNIYDFNPSQFIEDDDVIEKKKKDIKVKHKNKEE